MAHSSILGLTFLLCVLHAAAAASKKPNIVLILADDQDQMLGGMDFLPYTKKYLADQGMNFTNFFVNTPVCCPSRAELIAGRYGHNNLVEMRGTGGGCMRGRILCRTNSARTSPLWGTPTASSANT